MTDLQPALAQDALVQPPRDSHARGAGLDAGVRRAALAVGAMALGYGAVARGGFYQPTAAVLGLGLLAAGLAASRPPRDLRIPGFAFALLGLGLVPAAWATHWPRAALIPASTIAAACGAFLLARAFVEQGRRADLLALLEWIGVGVALAGTVGLALHAEPLAARATGLWRAGSTLTYANATGLLLVLALAAAACRGATDDAAGSRLAAFAILSGIAATVSRGAVMALGVWAIGAAVLGGRDLLRRLIRPGLGALVAAAGLVPSIVGAARPLPAVVGVAIGAAIAAVPSGRVRPRRARIWVIAAAVLLVAGGAWAVARDGGSLLRTRADATPASRFESWGGAIDAFRSSPWVGTGPGSLDLLFHASGSGQARRPMASPFAHNEYLQVLAETGALGLAGVMAALVLLTAWCWRRRPPASSPERIVWAAGAAACAAFALHSFVDFEWHFPVVVAFAFAWLGLATTRPAVPDEKGER